MSSPCFNCTNSQADSSADLAAISLIISVYQFVFAWLVPLLYCTGTLGTLTCIIVLARRHSTQPEVRPWFIALSLLDIYVLTIGLPIMYLNIVQVIMALRQAKAGQRSRQQSLDPRQWGEASCYCLTTLQFYGLIASSWVQVGISLLRCSSTIVRVDTRRSRLALAAALTLPLVVAAVAVPSTVRYDRLKPHTRRCGQRSSYYLYSTMLLRVLLPAVCLIVSTGVILRNLRRFSRAFGGALVGHQQRRVSLTLIGMNSTFLLFALPYEAYLMYASVRRQELLLYSIQSKAALKIAEKVFAIGMYANNATNWIFYCALGRRFRRELRRLLACSGRQESANAWRLRQLRTTSGAARDAQRYT